MAAATISVDEFQALERKVLQTVDLIKKEREQRTAAEAERDAALAEAATAQAQIAAVYAEISAAKAETAAAQAEIAAVKSETAAVQTEAAELRERLTAAGEAQDEVDNLQREREAVRLRVEKMVATLDELL